METVLRSAARSPRPRAQLVSEVRRLESYGQVTECNTSRYRVSKSKSAFVLKARNDVHGELQISRGIGDNSAISSTMIFSSAVHTLFWVAALLIAGSVLTSIFAVVVENRMVAVSAAGLMAAGFLAGVAWLDRADVERQQTKHC